MKILLTNDDGIDAPGLAALAAALAGIEGIEPIVVAPDRQRSECSHSVTTREMLRLEQRGENQWTVNGTPVDCVRVAYAVLEPQLEGVLSGVNDGGNVGSDIYMSGTVAAAREASVRGLPAVAISHYRHPDIPRVWEHIPRWIGGHLLPLLTTRHVPGHYWNVNLPAVDPDSTPAVVPTVTDPHPMPIRFERNGSRLTYNVDYHNRPRQAGTDVSECFAGKISISHIPLGF